MSDPDAAFFAAEQGADFIGMVLTPGYRRSVTLSRAKQIARACCEGGAKPVAIFVVETPQEVEVACYEMGIDTVQFYPQGVILPPHLKRFYVNEQPARLREGQDYLLIESSKPGSGVGIDPKMAIRKEAAPFFLAGGLSTCNVKEMIKSHRPIGVDVSSGVERDGYKNRELILEFIAQVKSCE